jgi:ankyrin repeat protein
MGCHVAIVEFLVSEVGIACRRITTERGDTALHVACRHGQSAVVETLLRLNSTVSRSGECASVRQDGVPYESCLRCLYAPGDERRISPLGDAVLAGALRCV